jgi:taurine--2-oxoglutarate transaminase
LTYSGHPLACAAAIATINAYKDEKIIENAKEQGKFILKRMEDMMAKHKCVGNVRNIGVFGCIELVKNRETKEPIVPWNGSGEVMNKVSASFLADGIFMDVRWNYILVVPPLIIKAEEIEEAFVAIDKALTIADNYVE